jgi:hypothetical protein
VVDDAIDRELTTAGVAALTAELLDELDTAFSRLKKLKPPDAIKEKANRRALWERALVVPAGGEKSHPLQAEQDAADKEGDRLAKQLREPTCAAGDF